MSFRHFLTSVAIRCCACLAISLSLFAAARLVLTFALDQLSLQRIEIVAAVGNTGSQRVAEKVGAKRESLARNRCRTANTPQDAYIYSVIPVDLSGKRE